MNTYLVQHRITHERDIVQAESAQEACKLLGWMIGECFVAIAAVTKVKIGDDEHQILATAPVAQVPEHKHCGNCVHFSPQSEDGEYASYCGWDPRNLTTHAEDPGCDFYRRGKPHVRG